MLLGGAFTVLLLINGVSAVAVPPPTNVIVSCQNVKVTVSWEYSIQQPQTTFRVEVENFARCYVNETTTDHHFDLSQFVWASERYMGFNTVTVTAVQGGSRSEPVESKSFTFSEHKTADINCKLNFPPVDLKVEDSRPTVMFKNPLHHYSELQNDEAISSLKFTVSPGGESKCLRNEKICRHEIEFPEGAEQCVNLTGKLYVGSQYVLFNELHHICPGIPSWVYTTIFIVLLFVLVVVITVVSVFIIKTRSWTMKTPPDSLTQPPPNPDLKFFIPPTTPISAVRVEAAWLKLEEEGTDDDSSDGSIKTEYTSIYEQEDEQEEEVEEENEDEEGGVSPYDRPQNLQVDMGDGDMVSAYSGR